MRVTRRAARGRTGKLIVVTWHASPGVSGFTAGSVSLDGAWPEEFSAVGDEVFRAS